MNSSLCLIIIHLSQHKNTTWEYLIFLYQVGVEGWALVRRVAVGEDPDWVKAYVSHMIRAFDIHMDGHRQSKADWEQSRAVQYFCWSMTVRNLSRLLWGFTTRMCEGRCQISCLSEPPLPEPHVCSQCVRGAGACVCVVPTHYVDAGAHKEKQTQLETGEKCLTPANCFHYITMVYSLFKTMLETFES